MTLQRATIRIVLLSCLCAVPARADDVRLAKGDILVSTRAVAGSDMPEASVQAVIDAPPDKVWRLIDECGRYKGRMPRITASRELERKGGRVVCEVTVEMPFPFSDLTAVSEAQHVVGPPRWSRTWKLVRGDYDKNAGSWVLSAFDEKGTRTRAVYKLHVEPHVTMPSALLKKAQSTALPGLMERLRALVK